MKKFLFLMFSVLIAFGSMQLSAQQTVEIGTGSTTTNSYLPLYTLYNNTLSEQIYTASEIGMPGTISSISFYNAGTTKSPDLKIYMVNTDKTAFSSTTDWITVTNSDLVYNGTSVALTAGQWTTIQLDNPFFYDGVSNLGLIVDGHMSYSSGLSCYVFTGTSNCAMYVYSDGTDYNAVGATYTANSRVSVKNHIKLEITPGTITCHAVGVPTVSNITATNATITWGTPEDGGLYVMQYKTSTDTWDGSSVTEITTMDTTANFYDGLSPMTTYDVRIANICGGNDTSLWRNISFTTACTDITTLPFTENFDSYTGASSTTASTNNLPYCWSYLNTGSSTSYSGYPIVYASATYAASGSNSLRFYTYTTSGTYDDQMAILPQIDPILYPVSSLQLSFDARNNSSYTFTVVVGVIANPSDKTTFVPVDTIVTTSNTYANYEFPFSQYTGPEGFIAIMAPRPASSYNAGYIDNIVVDLIPTCPKPKNIASSNPTLSSIDLSWTEMGSATAWDIEYGPTGFTPGTGTIENATTNPYTLNGLESSTVYDFYVRANCGGGDYSNWSNVYTIGTECAAVTILPFTENFDSLSGYTSTSAAVNNLPYCWSTINNGTSTSYSGYPIIYTSATTAASGSNSMRFYTYSTSGTYDDQMVVLPEIDPTTYPMNNLQLTLDARNNSTYTFTLVVGVMTNPTDKTTFVPVDTIVTTSNTYTNYEIPFDQYTGTGSYIAMMAPKTTSATYNTGYIDNLMVDVIPTCPKPKNLAASNATVNSIDIAWTEMGNATSWEIEYGPMGFTQGDGTIESTTSNPTTINGLEHSTGYDFYVRATCGGGDNSYWSSKLTAATACAPIENLPYVQNFDEYEGATTTSVSVNNLPYCWSNISSTSGNYAGYPIIYTSATFAASGNNSMRFYSGTASGTYDDEIAILPEIDVTSFPTNTLQISFDARNNSTYTFQLVVGVMTSPTDKTSFVPIDTIVTTSNTYANYTIPFDQYTGTGSYIALMAPKPASSFNSGYVDNVVLEVIPSCPRPLDFTATSTVTDEVVLSWTDNFSSQWDILYGPTGFDPTDPSAGTMESGVTSNPYTLSGLAAGIYDFYVRANCGAGDVSEWTLTPVSASPYTITMGITGTDTVTGCDFTVTDDGGIAGDYSNNCNYTLVIFPGEADSVVSVSGTFVGETTVDYLSVYNGTDVDESNLLQKIVSGTTGNLINFGPLSSTTGPLTLLFHSDGSVVRNGFAAQVSCVEAPACPEPFNVHAIDVTNNEATIGWEVMEGAATSFNVVIGTSPNTNPDAASDLITINTNEYTFTGLTPYTDYYVFVQTDCGNDVSEWTNAYGFRTSCDPVTTLPLSENFDATTGATTTSVATSNLPYCWSNINEGTSTSYSGYPIVYASATYAASGSNSLRFYTYSPSGTYDDQIAVLPLIDPDLFPINTLQISFDARLNSTSYPFKLVVGVLSSPSDKSTFVPIDTIDASSTTYQHYEIPFNGYEGSGSYIALMAPRPATSYNQGYVDNILVEEIPSCAKPIDFALAGVAATSVDLTWVELGDATTWEIVYGPQGFTPSDTAGTYVQTTDNPFTLDNLTPSTTYDIYLRSDCGGEYSPYAYNVITVTTACLPVDSLPYAESFDTYSTGTGVYLPCWDRINTYSSSSTNYPYISTTHYDGVGALYLYAGTSGTYNVAITPMFDENIPVNTLQASFMYRTGNATSKLIVGVMTNPADITTFTPIDTVQPSASSVWEPFEVSFSQYTGQGHYIAFYNVYNTTTCYGYLDQVVIDLIPTCPRPLHVTGSNATTTSIDLSWEQDGSPLSWVIEYGPSGFTPGTGTEVNASTNPFTVTGLTASTMYDFYVTADCGGGDVSPTSFVSSAATACAAINNLPFTEDFDVYGTGTYAYPICWNKYTTYTASPNLPYISSTHYAGTGSLYFYCTSGYYNVAITPEFDATIPINTLQATFMYRATNSTDFLIVGVMSNPADFTTFVPVDTVAPTGTASTWTEKEVVFNGYTGNGHYIAFHNGNPNASCYTYIDNLFIDLIPSCPKPQNLHVVNATTSSIELGWTETGSATSWEIAYGAPGFDLDDASATTVVTAASNPFTVTGLNSTSTYEFYVRASCGGTDFSYWSSSLQASTSMVPVSLPYTADFSTNDTWVLNNGSCTNYWMKGTVNNEAALFVTNNGSTPSYTISSISASAAQKLFTVGTSDSITITFDAMVDGEGGYDYLKLFLAPAATQFPPSTTAPSTGDYAHRDYSTNAYNFYANGYGTQSLYPYVLNKLTNTIHVVAKMPNPNTNPTSASTALLAIVWRNDGSGGTQPPATITNLTVTADGGQTVTDPSVATNPATGISQTAATLNGTITNPDNVTITAKGFAWKLASASTFTEVNVTGNALTHTLSNLTENTQYTYKAFITYNGTTVYGNEVNFTTLQQGQATEPSATTAAATNVTQTTATLNGSISNPDNVTITAKGFEWKATAGGTYTPVTVTGNNLTYNLTGLTANTGYTYKAFVTTANGTHYGAEMTFTTLGVEPCNVPTNVTPSAITHESITLNWDADANVNSWNIQYRPQGGQLSNTTTNTNSYTITGLQPETTYEIQVQANCGDGNFSEWTSAITATTTTGIESWLSNSMSLYPNPAKEYVDIRVDGELNVKMMEVYDVYGKLINTVNVIDNPTRINVSGLANGMYFVRVTTEEGVVTKTFVKK
jgi:chitodextrinase